MAEGRLIFLDFNNTITFERYETILVDGWFHDEPDLRFREFDSPAFLRISLSGVTMGGTLSVFGEIDNTPVQEEIFFSGEGVLLSANKFKLISGLTPSWEFFSITISGVNELGEVVGSTVTYGPFLCSIAESNTYTDYSRVARPGQTGMPSWRITVYSFKPQVGDRVRTSNGITGQVGDIYPLLLPNLQKGWSFLVIT